MIKFCILLALTIASVSALQDSAAEAGPEPYSYAYQTESHGASEQRDQQGRVTGFYTLSDADGRERRVEYTADENGFHAKVATNEVGTRAESPADVEVVAAEPTPAQYAAYTQTSFQQQQQAAAPVQGAQFVRQQTYQVSGAPQFAANFARSGYISQYAAGYKPQQGSNSYYSSGVAYPAVQGAAQYGANYGANYYSGVVPGSVGYYAVTTQPGPVPVGYYAYSGVPAGQQYYSYRSSSTSGAVPVPAVAGLGAGAGAGVGAAFSAGGGSSPQGYRYVSQPAGAVTTTYRQVSTGTVPVAGVSTYSAGGFPAGGVGAHFDAAVGADGVTGETSGSHSSSSSSRSASYQGSSNYLVLKKRDAQKAADSN